MADCENAHAQFGQTWPHQNNVPIILNITAHLRNVITDLSVIQYHFNGCYKPDTLQAQRNLKIENGKNIGQKIMKPKVQC